MLMLVLGENPSYVLVEASAPLVLPDLLAHRQSAATAGRRRSSPTGSATSGS
jgi:hypothetical protein